LGWGVDTLRVMARTCSFALAFPLMVMIVGCSLAGRASAAIGACTASQLWARASLQDATGSELGGISLRNQGARTCLLPRRPRLTMFWEHQRLHLVETPYATYQPSIGQRRVRRLKPRQWAFVPIAWSNWCGRTPWGKGYFRPHLQLTLANSTSLTVTLRHPSEMIPPRCDRLDKPTIFSVGSFYTPLPVGWKP
jgi:hypothetical protein